MARCPGLMALKVLQTVVRHTAGCNILNAGQMDGGETHVWWCVLEVGGGRVCVGGGWLCSPKMVLICTQMAVWKPACRKERNGVREEVNYC